MEEKHEIAVTQMRKSVEKLGCSTENYNDLTLMRFLIARSMDIEKAAKMFTQWKKWRDDFLPSGFIPESEVPDELGSRKVYLQIPSSNAPHHHPVVIVKANKHFSSKDQLQFKKFVVHFLEKSIASSFVEGKEKGDEKLMAILDLGNITYRNVDPRALITGFQFLQGRDKLIHFYLVSKKYVCCIKSAPNYYPERLAKCYIISMPWFFVSVWKMVSVFLEKTTLEKIVIVGNDEEERKSFINEIGEDTLPEEYGGLAKLTAIQDVTIHHLPESN
ncbi:sec14 cytosolic factor-like isoform X1 [Papaver somniferum]|uniref:sec14 cytosolic factor-like isoform X1 n=1 Tax=Papaver somniferum TaxID=3469 RepID=UPI000E6FB86F|nr:sec14 cytosolic factor-like isoform X1 [Papaver somniferum]